MMVFKNTNPYSFYNKKLTSFEEIIDERLLFYRHLLKEENPGKINFHIGQIIENFQKESKIIHSVVKNSVIKLNINNVKNKKVENILLRINYLTNIASSLPEKYEETEKNLLKIIDMKLDNKESLNIDDSNLLAKKLVDKKILAIKGELKNIKELLKESRKSNLIIEKEFKSLNINEKEELLIHITKFIFESKINIKKFMNKHREEMKVTWDEIKWPTVVANSVSFIAVGATMLLTNEKQDSDLSLITLIGLIGTYIGGYGFWLVNVSERVQKDLFIQDFSKFDKITNRKHFQALFTEMTAFMSIDIPSDTVTFIPLYFYNMNWITKYSSQNLPEGYSDLAPILGLAGTNIIGTIVWLAMFLPIYPIARTTIKDYFYKPIGFGIKKLKQLF